MTTTDEQIAAGRPFGSAIVVDISATDHTPDDTSRGFYVGVAGNVKVDLEGFEDGKSATGITFIAMPVGLHKIRVSKVYKTGTAATNMLLMY
jgi:hypothetical protein